MESASYASRSRTTGAGAIGAGWPVWEVIEAAVLQTAAEVSHAEERARGLGLARPPVRAKYWDNLLALDALQGLEQQPVVDLGCRSGIILTWLYQRGFVHLAGCDLRAPWPPIRGSLRRGRFRDALTEASMYARHRSRMRRAPVESTGFPDAHFAAATSMSVIEHSVALQPFFSEAFRILRPGALLLISTDYWPEAIDTRGGQWNDRADIIFDRSGIEIILQSAGGAGFLTPTPSLDVTDPVVRWAGRRYTFAYLTFHKPGSAEPG